MPSFDLLPPRSALFLPASNPRAIEKVAGLACDMVILDLEDAVPEDRKEAARAAAVEAVSLGFGGRPVAVRINPEGTPQHAEDVAAMRDARVDYVVLPKVENAGQVETVSTGSAKPVIAMIESAAGVLATAAIAAARGTGGLFMGTNDLRSDLRIPPDAGRQGLAHALQAVIVAARAAGRPVFDGVCNRLDDPAALEAECREGRAFGFDGKTLIHPNQIEIANRIFRPGEAELDEARALIAAFNGGAGRFDDRMIESMHVDAARRTIARAEGLRTAD